jgi:hypothetical protein
MLIVYRLWQPYHTASAIVRYVDLGSNVRVFMELHCWKAEPAMLVTEAGIVISRRDVQPGNKFNLFETFETAHKFKIPLNALSPMVVMVCAMLTVFRLVQP